MSHLKTIPIRGITLSIMILIFPFAGLAADTDKARMAFESGLSAYNMKNFGDAEHDFLITLAADHNNIYAHHYLGKIYLQTKQYGKAKMHLLEACAIPPDLDESFDLIDLKLDLAMVHLETGSYKRASELFMEICAIDPQNVAAHYNAGVSLYNEKKYRLAITYFAKINETDSLYQTKALHYTGMCFNMLGDKQNASLFYAKKHDLFDKKNKKEPPAKEPSKKYSLEASGAYKYDSNVGLINEDKFSKKADKKVEAGVAVQYDSDPNNNSYQLGAGLMHAQIWYEHLKEYDETGSMASVYAKIKNDPVSIKFRYEPIFYTLSSEPYLMANSVGPELEFKVNDNIQTRLGYFYSEYNYYDNDKKDGHANEMSANLIYSFPNKAFSIDWGVGSENVTSSHFDYDYENLIAKIGMSFKTTFGTNFSLSGRYDNRRYGREHSAFDFHRQDSSKSGIFSLTQDIILDRLNLGFEYGYYENESNIDWYDYDRHIASVSLGAKF